MDHKRWHHLPSQDLVWLPPPDTQSLVHRSESQGSRPFGGKSLWRLPSVISTAAKWACSLLGANKIDWATSSWLYGAELKHCTACLFDSLPSPSVPLYGYHQDNIEYSELISSTTTVTAIFNYWIIICTHQHNGEAWSSAYITHEKLVCYEGPWWSMWFTYFSESSGLCFSHWQAAGCMNLRQNLWTRNSTLR